VSGLTSSHGSSVPSDALFAVHADFCQVFADEKRLRIMWFLGGDEHSVSEIAEAVGASLQNTSQHLRVLRDKGAVCHRRDGRSVRYRVSNPKFLQGARLIRQGLVEQLRKQGGLE
jgi:DNA-binding transcriptional ArsR family regulator